MSEYTPNLITSNFNNVSGPPPARCLFPGELCIMPPITNLPLNTGFSFPICRNHAARIAAHLNNALAAVPA